MPFAAFVIVGFLFAFGLAQASNTDALALEVRSDRLSLRAEDVPLTTVLKQLTKDAGISFRFTDDIEERVSLELADVSLAEGLERLLQRFNSIVLYDAGKPVVVFVLGVREEGVAATAAQPKTPEPAADVEVKDGATEAFDATLAIEALEQELRAAEAKDPAVTAGLLQHLLADPHPDPSIRITVLQWTAAREDTGNDALIAALLDYDPLVQNAAMQILLERGVDDWTLEGIRAAAEAEDELTVWQTISAISQQK